MRKLLLGLPMLLLLFFLAQPASAVEVLVPDEGDETGAILVEESETISDDLFIFGNTVDIRGTVDGDVYVFGGQVSIPGIVTGDVYAGAGNVDLSGDVYDDLFLGAGQAIVSGTVGDNMVVGGGQIQLSEESSVGRDLVAGAGILESQGLIGRYLSFGAGQLNVDGEVGGSVRGEADELFVGEEAVIRGDVDYKGAAEPVYGDGATVEGERMFEELERGSTSAVMTDSESDVDSDDSSITVGSVLRPIGSWLLKLLGMVLIGVVMILGVPKLTVAAEEAVTNRAGASFLTGLIALVAFPLLAILLLITFVGAKLAIVLGALLLVFALVSQTFVGLWLGRRILSSSDKNKKNVHDLWVMSLGVLLISILVSLPFIGFLFTILVTCLGVGGTILAVKARNSDTISSSASPSIVK